MHNIKRFLEDGVFVPPEQAMQMNGGSRSAELVAISHISRIAKGLSYRFVIVQGVDKFRPDYWYSGPSLMSLVLYCLGIV